ncbi:MAG: hypothetical protein ACRC2T_06785 [Thermoguttaceae bacterium]
MKLRKKALFSAFYAVIISALLGIVGETYNLGCKTAHAEWYKGNLHAHSFWSDGRVFPEESVDWYKNRGYNFFSLTDHRQVQTNPDEWIIIDERKEPNLEKILEKYGEKNVVVREVDGKKEVRLQTFDQLKRRFEEPGKFILIPGMELTGNTDGSQVHMNVVNIPQTLKYQKRETVPKTISSNYTNAQKRAGELGVPILFIQNHPIWQYFDIKPEDLLNENQNIQFFEITNGDLSYPAPEQKSWRQEKFWDVVTAMRLLNGLQPIYGVGTDDRHSYDNPAGAFGWTVVDADELTPKALIKAMFQGKFYASTGVELEKADFDADKKELFIKVKPKEDRTYRIDFIGTKLPFVEEYVKTEPEKYNIPAGSAHEKQQARQITVYPDQFGIVLSSVEGLEATYKMDDEDMYVRARITEIKDGIDEPTPPEQRSGIDKTKVQAWTQPMVP